MAVTTRLGAGWFGLSNSSKNKRYVFSPKRTHWFWGPPSHLFSEYRGSFFQVKRPGRDLKSLLSSAEVKNEWSCASVPSMCLRAAHRVNFTFYLIVCFVQNVLFFFFFQITSPFFYYVMHRGIPQEQRPDCTALKAYKLAFSKLAC